MGAAGRTARFCHSLMTGPGRIFSRRPLCPGSWRFRVRSVHGTTVPLDRITATAASRIESEPVGCTRPIDRSPQALIHEEPPAGTSGQSANRVVPPGGGLRSMVRGGRRNLSRVHPVSCGRSPDLPTGRTLLPQVESLQIHVTGGRSGGASRLGPIRPDSRRAWLHGRAARPCRSGTVSSVSRPADPGASC